MIEIKPSEGVKRRNVLCLSIIFLSIGIGILGYVSYRDFEIIRVQNRKIGFLRSMMSASRDRNVELEERIRHLNMRWMEDGQKVETIQEKYKQFIVDWVYLHSNISCLMAERIVNEANSTSYPLFLLALMKTESNFNPTAISSKGAMGLGQVMPVHKAKLVEANILVEMRDIFDIPVAIKATEYLWKAMIVKARGDINEALHLYLGCYKKSYVTQILKDYFYLSYLNKGIIPKQKRVVEEAGKTRKEQVYVVQEGDNLTKIVLLEYGRVSQEILDSIVEQNGLQGEDRIDVGQRIILPELK